MTNSKSNISPYISNIFAHISMIKNLNDFEVFSKNYNIEMINILEYIRPLKNDRF